jgi:hypothetical protein
MKTKKSITEYETVECLECHRELGSITSHHLKKCCGLTIEQYKEKYPNAETVSEKIKETRKQNCNKINNRMKRFYCVKCGINYIEKSISNHWEYTCDDCKNPKYPGKIYLPDKDLVVCQICFQAMEQISYKHTYYIHGISLQEYRKRFPKAWVTNKRIRQERRKRGLENNPSKIFDNKLKMSKAQRYKANDYINKYPWIFPTIEKIRDGKNGIEVICKKCKKWFPISGYQLQDRIRALVYGSDGAYLYCSDECKGSCLLYRLQPITYLKPETENLYTDSEYQIFRAEVFKRQKDQYGYNFCEKCGSEENLHVHHEKPQKTHPMMVLDPDNGIILCERCHIGEIHKDDCSLAKLANKICI